MNIHRSPAIWTLLLVSALFKQGYAQQVKVRGGTLIHISSHNTSFPDTGRRAGHLYDSVLYDAAGHYSDSSVAILVPDRLPKTENLNIVFWFHGWRNNIDTALSYYHLEQQFLAADPNAILVLAETARNSPDSYGGKLEQRGVFSALTEDVLTELKKRKLISKSCAASHIILAGHSGAFRVIAKILQNGGLSVKEVDLFDALYSQTEIFNDWIKKDAGNRFINWYTNEGGGTDEESLKFMELLKNEGMMFLLSEEKDLTPAILRSNRILFVHSARAHNDIIFNPDNFRLLLENTPFLTSIR